tara:strand:- start:20596 stop:20745 length:150 start_codon:yes stop_codon:yes gene_type:complete
MKPNFILIIFLLLGSLLFFVSEIVSLKKQIRKLDRNVKRLLKDKNKNGK